MMARRTTTIGIVILNLNEKFNQGLHEIDLEYQNSSTSNINI